MAGIEVLGTADNISIMVAGATEEALEKLKSAGEIRLVKMPLPEFRDYARLKYPDELDEDLITMIEDLIERQT